MAEEKLTARQEKILYIIIKQYLETGEPVGSRTISKDADMNFSSATIRNEMSDLTDMGYIVQPHTSAGRIPSDKGYRFYVDHLIAEKDQEVSEMKELVIEQTHEMQKMLKQVAKVLANNTQYTTMISAPSVLKNRIKFVQLSAVSEDQVLSVVVMDGNLVKNKIIQVEDALDNETLLKLNMLLNTNLNGLSVHDINLTLMAVMKQQAGEYADIIEEVLQSIAETIQEDSDLEIYTSGTTNIFKYPELSDSLKASQLISAIEDKSGLKDLILDVEASDPGTGIQVYIGEESKLDNMKDCSVVTATYELGEGIRGTIGIIGPKRMDYENVVNNIRSLKNQLDSVLKKAEKKTDKMQDSE